MDKHFWLFKTTYKDSLHNICLSENVKAVLLQRVKLWQDHEVHYAQEMLVQPLIN